MNELVKLLCPSIGTHEIKRRGRKHEQLLSSSKVIPGGLEPTTTRTGIWHSIQLMIKGCRVISVPLKVSFL
jgi:hypothetical protein